MTHRVRASRVEVAQAAVAHSVNLVHPVQQALNHRLAFPVRATGNHRFIFRDGDSLRSVEQGGGRRQDEAFDTVFGCGFEQVCGGNVVVAQVLEWLLHAFRHDDVRREVEDAIELVRLKQRFERCRVHQIADDERGFRVDCLAMPRNEAVEHHHFIIFADQQVYHVAANVPRATCDENFHTRTLLQVMLMVRILVSLWIE